MRKLVALSVVAAWLTSLAPIAAQAAPATSLRSHATAALRAAQHHHQAVPPETGSTATATVTPRSRAQRSSVTASTSLASLATTGGTWSELGPKPESGGYSTGMSGRMLALARTGTTVTSNTPIFAGAAGGGVWKSVDGSNWSVAGNFDTMPDLAIDALAVDPATWGTPASLRILAGGGEVANAGDAQVGAGIYLSTDGGTTWTREGASQFTGYAVSSIVFGSGYVFAGITRKGGGPTWANAGLAVSTDGGATWTVPANSLAGHSVTDLSIDTAGNLFAAIGDGSSADGIYYSTDHGASFTRSLSDTAGRQLWWKVALAPSDVALARGSQVVYAAEGEDGTSTGAIIAMWRSADGGQSWSNITNGLDTMDASSGAHQSWYDFWVAVDPNNHNTVYYATTDIFRTTTAGGANTWADLTNIYGGPSGSVTPIANFHPDQHAIAFLDSNNIFIGNDGGVQKTANAMSSFATANGNLGTTQFYGGALSANQTILLGGLQDNGNPLSLDSGSTWNDYTSGDGFYTAIDPVNSSNLYAEYAFGGLEISTTGGAGGIGSFSPSFDPSGAADPTVGFVAPLTLDANGTLYSGRHRLWKSATPCAGTCGASNFSGQYISSSGAAGGDLLTASASLKSISSAGSTIYVTDNYGHTYVSTNTGGTWSRIDDSITNACGAPYYCRTFYNPVNSITMDTSTTTIAYETIAGPTGGGKHIYVTTTGGTAWTDISLTLPDVGFNTIAIDPNNHSILYAGSDAGVFVSPDQGATWSILGGGLPNAKVNQLVVKGTELYAFTHGRGLWKVSTAVTPVVAPSAPAGLVATAATSPYEVDLAWTASTGATSYSVKRSTASGGPYTAIATGLGTTTYTDRSVSPGTAYYYIVTASNSGGESAASAQATATTVTVVETLLTMVQKASYHLDNYNDGAFTSWVEIDPTLRVTEVPANNSTAVVSANIDLWTSLAGYNQDIGIFMSDNGGADQLVAWKESGGFAGTFSPNAAFVQVVLPVLSGHTYLFKMMWKPNKAAPGQTVYAGAGTATTQFSPTRLTVRLVPTAIIQSAVQYNSYHLDTYNDGGFTSWVPVDPALNVAMAGAETSVQVGANMDLWTSAAGYNQDIGIFVSDNGGADALLAWKESGGFAGTFSPNAAFVTATYATHSGHNYTFKLKWKPNKPAPGGTLYGAGGTATTQFSPTRLTVEQLTPGTFASSVQNASYHIDNPNTGAFNAWVELNPADRASITPAATAQAVVTGNMDLWTAQATYNQDVAIFSCDASGGLDCTQFGNFTMIAWKESGGFAGTFSPNAATVQTAVALTAGHPYTFALGWKANKPVAGGVIYGGAGTSITQFSPTTLVVQIGG